MLKRQIDWAQTAYNIAWFWNQGIFQVWLACLGLALFVTLGYFVHPAFLLPALPLWFVADWAWDTWLEKRAERRLAAYFRETRYMIWSLIQRDVQ